MKFVTGRSLFVTVIALTLPGAAGIFAQQPVAVGKASYASSPPPRLDAKRNVDICQEVEKRQLYLVKDDGRPIPSNKWYQNLLFKQYGTGLWAMPHKVDATKDGIEVFFPTKPNGDGTRMVAENPLVVTGKDFKPVDSRAKTWTDWTVAFRMFESASRFMDVTLGEGMPAVWCEFTGVEPVIAFRRKVTPTFFDLTGKPVTLPVTGDALGITYDGRSFAVFAPDGTKFEQGDAGIAVSKSAFLVI